MEAVKVYVSHKTRCDDCHRMYSFVSLTTRIITQYRITHYFGNSQKHTKKFQASQNNFNLPNISMHKILTAKKVRKMNGKRFRMQKCWWLSCYLKDLIWGPSQDELNCCPYSANDCNIPDNISILKFPGNLREILGYQEQYSWNDDEKSFSNSNIISGMAATISVFQKTKCEGCNTMYRNVSKTTWIITQCQITYYSWYSWKYTKKFSASQNNSSPKIKIISIPLPKKNTTTQISKNQWKTAEKLKMLLT